jgi:hypothetical protein
VSKDYIEQAEERAKQALKDHPRALDKPRRHLHDLAADVFELAERLRRCESSFAPHSTALPHSRTPALDAVQKPREGSRYFTSPVAEAEEE